MHDYERRAFLHWHPNADEWQYLHQRQGAGRGVLCRPESADPRTSTRATSPLVKRNNGHYVKNIANTELQFLEVFRSPYFLDVSLSEWLTHTPPAMVAATFNIDPADDREVPQG